MSEENLIPTSAAFSWQWVKESPEIATPRGVSGGGLTFDLEPTQTAKQILGIVNDWAAEAATTILAAVENWPTSERALVVEFRFSWGSYGAGLRLDFRSFELSNARVTITEWAQSTALHMLKKLGRSQ